MQQEKRRLKRRRQEKEELYERNHLLVVENHQLQLRIRHLHEELDFLKNLNTKAKKQEDRVAKWAENVVNRALVHQITKYNAVERQCCEMLRYAETVTVHNERLHMFKMNALFILEKLPYLMAINDDVEAVVWTTDNHKKGAISRGILQVCLQLYAIKTGDLTVDVDPEEFLDWRPDLNLKSSQVVFKQSLLEGREKWVSVDIKNYPVAVDVMQKVLTLTDFFSLIMMGSPATQAYVAENGGDVRGFNATVGHTNAIVPVSFTGRTPDNDAFNLNVIRPVQLKEEDLSFISASDYDDVDEKYTFAQALLPNASSDLELMEALGAYFSRGITLRKGSTVDGSETCDISILVGLKRASSNLSYNPDDITMLHQFYKTLALIGADVFMNPKMHSHNKLIAGFETILKTMVFMHCCVHTKRRSCS